MSACTNIDECAAAAAVCSPVAQCVDSAGSFGCVCPAGYAGDGTLNGTGCVDVDECRTGTHNCSITVSHTMRCAVRAVLCSHPVLCALILCSHVLCSCAVCSCAVCCVLSSADTVEDVHLEETSSGNLDFCFRLKGGAEAAFKCDAGAEVCRVLCCAVLCRGHAWPPYKAFSVLCCTP